MRGSCWNLLPTGSLAQRWPEEPKVALTQANADFPYFGSDLVGAKLVARTGIRIYFPAQAGAVNYAVNMDWVEY